MSSISCPWRRLYPPRILVIMIVMRLSVVYNIIFVWHCLLVCTKSMHVWTLFLEHMYFMHSSLPLNSDVTRRARDRPAGVEPLASWIVFNLMGYYFADGGLLFC
jgi:hypothetical protein